MKDFSRKLTAGCIRVAKHYNDTAYECTFVTVIQRNMLAVTARENAQSRHSKRRLKALLDALLDTAARSSALRPRRYLSTFDCVCLFRVQLYVFAAVSTSLFDTATPAPASGTHSTTVQ